MADQSVLIGMETSVHNPQPYRLQPHVRVGHVLVLGAPTPAKDALLWNMMVQDIEAGAGLAVIDTTGRFADPLLDAIPAFRAHHTYSFRPFDPIRVPGFNPFQGIEPPARPRAAQDIMELFKAIWDLDYDRTPLLLDLLRSSARVLFDVPDATLLSLYALLTNAQYRQRMVQQCEDPLTRRFWSEFEAWPLRDQRDKPQPVLTRLRAFLSDPQLRNVLGQVNGSLSLERIVAKRQILLADVSRIELGSETSRLFACLLVTRLKAVLEARRSGWPFYIYLPEADQVHVAIAGALLSGRYAAAGVVASAQGIAGYRPGERTALLTPETLIAFRLGLDDARLVHSRFPIARSETSLPILEGNRLAVSDWRYELKAVARENTRHRRQRAAIQCRSRRVLGVSRQTIEGKIRRFLENI